MKKVSKRRNDNPMPYRVYYDMLKYYPFVPGTSEKHDLHHALIDKGDVRGMPIEERRKIHDPRNLWWVSAREHASHANIDDKRAYYRLLCQRFGKHNVDEFVNSFNWKSSPPVTVEWLESAE